MSSFALGRPVRPAVAGEAEHGALGQFADTVSAFVDSMERIACIIGGPKGRIDWVDASTAASTGIGAGQQLWECVSASTERTVRPLLDERRDVERVLVSLLDAGGRHWPVVARIVFEGERFILIGEHLRVAPRPKASVIGTESVERIRASLWIASIVERSVHELRQALEAARAELREAAVTLDAARDVERRRLERDIHDSAQQKLLTVGLGLDLAAAVADQPAVERKLLALRAQVDDALKDLRDIVHGLRPAELDTAGLPFALGEATRAAAVPVTITARHVGRYPPDIESAVYYSCLEGVQNAVKHAQCTRIEIELEERGPALLFRVRDDGRGFAAERPRAGSGLAGVRDRLRAVGGRLRVVSSAGRGTTLSGSVRITAGSPSD